MREIKRILCPVDMSDASRHAMEHAIVIARWYNATITALHVYAPVYSAVPALAMAGEAEAPMPGKAEILQLEDDVAESVRFAKTSGVNLDVAVDTGPPAVSILDRAASSQADLIVIGMHRSNGLHHRLLGSVAEKVLRQAMCPVLTIPPRARTTSKLPFRRLLCPVDFSKSSLAALEQALSLAQEGDATLTILYVIESAELVGDRPPYAWEDRQQHQRETMAELHALVPQSVRDWCRPTARLGYGNPYRAILDTATEDSCDLIVMGVHSRNALDLMLFGSTTNQVVRRATCPVLTLRR
jgi:nucleotide-binding universal stress UspA family protein